VSTPSVPCCAVLCCGVVCCAVQVLRPAGPPVVRKAFYSDSQQGSCIISKNSAELAAGERAGGGGPARGSEAYALLCI